MVSRSDELATEGAGNATQERRLHEQVVGLLPRSLKSVDVTSLHQVEELSNALATEELVATGDSEPDAVLFWRIPQRHSGGFSVQRLGQLAEHLTVLHQRLPTSSCILVAVPLLPDDPTATAAAPPKGSLPPKHQPAWRQVIRLLAENGFAVRKEASWSDGERPRQEQSRRLICAQRDAFRIQRYGVGDETAILDLFSTCFHVSRGIDHWRWKYAENPFGETSISLARAENGALATHYAGFAMPFFYALEGRPRTFPALQMGDTMTHPEFRNAGRGRTGLLARTVSHFFSLHRGGPYGFFYGFNTGPIQRFCRWFIGGSRVEPVGYWRHQGSAVGDAWTATGYRVDSISEAGAEFDRLFRQAAPGYGFLVQRDARYLTWRYLQCPDIEYEVLTVRRRGRLVGWGAFRRHEGRILWGDAFIHPRHWRSAGALLEAAANRLGGADGPLPIEAWFSKRPEAWCEQLIQLGFARQPHPQGLGFMALPDGEATATEHLSDLYYTMGDGDLF